MDLEDYLTDLPAEHVAMFRFVQSRIHELWPEVDGRIAWSMPGFFPNTSVNSNHPLIFVRLNKHWLGIYATPEFNQVSADYLNRHKLSFSKGSIQVPYNYDRPLLTELLAMIIEYNGQEYRKI